MHFIIIYYFFPSSLFETEDQPKMPEKDPLARMPPPKYVLILRNLQKKIFFEPQRLTTIFISDINYQATLFAGLDGGAINQYNGLLQNIKKRTQDEAVLLRKTDFG